MARKDFEEIADHLADVIEAIRAKPLNEEFGAESLLSESAWAALGDKHGAFGWQLRELLRVFSAVQHTGEPGEGRYKVIEAIPDRSPFDGGPGRR
ncbi:hypothetical protein SAMN04487972_11040 [Paracoccus halophilus]|uniref:Uncharacterized protein n=1 Tax=Paracoccus halophilus TaxID=376733 RepID=A0A099EYB2_9RHOB|nr:hypothetical protein [Paracoccus halophilus]KGJ03219.1 hypothetical protein IT41_14865 [Paracoccus halophilus]SFA52856.1 hypothetical protein SAMN04487972_11040 [Paracoccus halophilus]